MNYNTQNAKITSITEKTLIVGMFAFRNDGTGFAAFKEWMNDIAEKHGVKLLFQEWSQQVTTG